VIHPYLATTFLLRECAGELGLLLLSRSAATFPPLAWWGPAGMLHWHDGRCSSFGRKINVCRGALEFFFPSFLPVRPPLLDPRVFPDIRRIDESYFVPLFSSC